jgi:hypothetical protein
MRLLGKKLLLGSVAGLAAISVANAADLPVKAKAAVQYVKICSLYGAGFYYVPGTDMCLKIGGWIRAEYAYGYGNSMTNGPFGTANGSLSGANAGLNTRLTNGDFNIRTRGYVTADARTQTAYGTVRGYIALGVNYDSSFGGGGSVFNSNRGFIQFAGFTFGTAQSFYDFFSAAASGYLVSTPSSDTGDPGWKVAAYTAQFGNGFSASLSVEEPRRSRVTNAIDSLAPTAFALGTLPPDNQKGNGHPDIVANIRVDQPWGSAQIMGALHEASAGYYGTTGGAVTSNGHPSDTWGYALGVGARIKFPSIGPGDYFQTQFNYTKGAARYAAFTPAGGFSPLYYSGNTFGYGVFSDGVFCGISSATGAIAYGGTVVCPAGGSSTDLTEVWNVNAHYEHFWTPALHTSLYGGYLETNYSAQANRALCANQFVNTFGLPPAARLGGCNNDFSWWWIGSRTQWDITKDLYVGLDVLYMSLGSASPGAGTTFVVKNGPQPAAIRTVSDQDTWSVRFRVHRNFYP